MLPIRMKRHPKAYNNEDDDGRHFGGVKNGGMIHLEKWKSDQDGKLIWSRIGGEEWLGMKISVKNVQKSLVAKNGQKIVKKSTGGSSNFDLKILNDQNGSYHKGP